MTWLFPLYWFGALAIAAPIVFHMWQRKPRSKRAFSALMFLSASPPRIASRNRIEHWVLLCLRAAALALIAFAFTRPLWRTPTSESEQTTDEQIVAILVDTSASMRRDGVWDDLTKQLDDRLADLPEKTSVALYRFDQELLPVVTFRELDAVEFSARREMLKTRLRELKPTWESTNLGDALIRMAAVLQEIQTERSKPVPRRIWLASDLQVGAEIAALKAYEWPDDLPVEIVRAKPLSPSNAGLQMVEKNIEAGDDVLRLRIINSAESTKDQFILKWDLPESPQLAVYVPPGQSRTVAPPPLPDGTAASSLLLEGDDNVYDNRVYVTESAVETRLVVYCGPESNDDIEAARFYLDRVFSASARYRIDIKNWRDANLAAAELPPTLFVLVQPDQEAESMVRNHLRKGGTVLIVAPNPEATRDCIALCGRDGISITESNVSRYAMLGEIDFDHPLFAPFAESQFSDFTGIRFWKHRSISGLNVSSEQTKDAGGGAGNVRDRVLAKFDDGDPAIIDMSVDRGRVLVFAAGWQPSDSQFARSSKFPTLMYRLLELASRTKPRSGNRFIGSPIEWPSVILAESDLSGQVRLPDGHELTDQPIDRPFSQTNEPGLYSLTIAGQSERVAINLAADESRTTPYTFEQLESLGLPLKIRERPTELRYQRERERQLQLVELEESQKIWRFALIAALIVLLLETLLSGVFESRKVMKASELSGTA